MSKVKKNIQEEDVTPSMTSNGKSRHFKNPNNRPSSFVISPLHGHK